MFLLAALVITALGILSGSFRRFVGPLFWISLPFTLIILIGMFQP